MKKGHTILSTFDKLSVNKVEGFTFFEVIVVIGILGLMLPAIFGIVFSILRQQSRIYALAEVKRQGDNILSIMENQIRNNALYIYQEQSMTNERCNTITNPHNSLIGSDFFFKDTNGNYFNYEINNDKISSKSASVPAGVDLTTSVVKVENQNGANFISCTRSSDYSTPIVTVKFKISFKNVLDQQFSMNYNTKFKMHNY